MGTEDVKVMAMTMYKYKEGCHSLEEFKVATAESVLKTDYVGFQTISRASFYRYIL